MDLGSRQVAPGNEAHHDGMRYGVKVTGDWECRVQTAK